MEDWLRQAENTLRTLYGEHVGNPGDLAIFRSRGDHACEILRNDGSRTVIDRTIIETFEQDSRTRALLIKKLKNFSFPPLNWIV